MKSDACLSRRSVIQSLVGGSLMLPGILSELLADTSAPAPAEVDPLAPRAPHFAPKAKRVIFLNMSGGASHVDSFDYKPKLIEDHNKSFLVPPRMLEAFAPNNRVVEKYFKRPQWEFKQRGESGLWISELFPHIAGCADDLCLLRSMKNDHPDHFQATLGIHTGSVTFPRPSVGSWVSYGLGTENRNLPSFVVLAPHLPYAGGQVWASDFLPGCHQGTLVAPGAEPIANIKPRQAASELQEMELGLSQFLNRRHRSGREDDANLAARIKSFETAYGMQSAAPEAFDLTHESDATLQLYGLPRGSTKGFAWQCLMARRLAERGVRFVELIDTGASNNWDSHGDMNAHGPLAKNVDQPIAGLLKDLKSRGMLAETLVVWTTEFGRTPFNTGKDAKGREHHAEVFTSWMAGGGVKGGISYGSSDEHGCDVAEDEVHIHDFHATILHLLGLNHTRLTYRHAGRDYRLTDVAGRVVHDVIA
ncbi:MAG: DUF1501 domain-containing protein [Planctomycetaceae bacterium]|nr:DUF1501 domain-containing protein [Planctomycetaceae bacterium]